MNNKIGKQRVITFRTLDIGDEKIPTYMKKEDCDNPALGLRGIRLLLDNKDLFRRQLRAILKASNDNYLIRTEQASYVYRKARHKLVYRQIEKQVYSLLENKNILYFDDKSGDLISLFLKNSSHPKAPFTKEFLSSLAHELRFIHSHSFSVSFELENELAKYKKRLSSLGLKLSDDYKSFEDKLLQNKPKRLLKPCLCHNDLILENILLFDGEICIIDYEYACANHPSWDIATFFTSAKLSQDKQRLFLKHYLEQKIDIDEFLEEISFQTQAIKAITYLWELARFGVSNKVFKF